MFQTQVTVQRLMRLLAWVRRPEFLVFLPAITLAGFWMGGERVLLLLALGLPLLFAATGPAALTASAGSQVDEPSSIGRAIAALDAILPGIAEAGR